MIEKFIGLWVDNNANLLLIEPWKLNIVKVLFASGKTKAPVSRDFMQQQFTVDVPGEYRIGAPPRAS
ncbi:hypothetical protein BAZOLSSOX_2132 [uncultured Gammaproteobacteria bacterium]|nr:hypothetical protein BAZOLSSOX_2132 [uncultured Gammaproteobacteria bacterium]